MKKMLSGIVTLLMLGSCNNQGTESAPVKNEEVKVTEMKPAEFADAKYADAGKRFLASFSKADIDAWVSDMSDNAVFVFSNGDSLAGKAAIGTYWKERWTVVDSVTFSNEIWLPIQVNKPQSVEAPGIWLLGWYMFNEKFKNGKRSVQWAHDDMHFNADGKVDRMIHYMDMAPIKAALGK